jgi:hypothetical protein
MKDLYKTYYLPSVANAHDDRIMIRGFFIGTDFDHKIAFRGGAIFYRWLTHEFEIVPEDILPLTANVPNFVHNGHLEIITEFNHAAPSDRAKKILDEDDKKIESLSAPEAIATRLSSYVAAVRDWSDDADIGGDIATIILYRDKTWRWFHRPDFCPENYERD